MNQKFRWHFIKPFAFMREGQMLDSVIAYDKRPWTMKVKPTATGHKHYVGQFAYHLYIDLWLVKLSFRWLGKELTQ